jgi:hypothetical protein
VNSLSHQVGIQCVPPYQLRWGEIRVLLADAFMQTVDDCIDIGCKLVEYGCVDALGIGYGLGIGCAVLARI